MAARIFLILALLATHATAGTWANDCGELVQTDGDQLRAERLRPSFQGIDFVLSTDWADSVPTSRESAYGYNVDAITTTPIVVDGVPWVPVWDWSNGQYPLLLWKDDDRLSGTLTLAGGDNTAWVYLWQDQGYWSTFHAVPESSTLAMIAVALVVMIAVGPIRRK